MKRILILAGIAWLTATPVAAARDDRAELLADRDDMATVEAGDARMNAAISEARAALPDFLTAYRTGQFDRATFVIKYPLGGWEHIWVEIDAIENDIVVGRLSNVPAQPEYQQGQAVRVPLTDVSDWAYRDKAGVMVGHRTTRVILPQLDSETRRSVEEFLGWK